MRQLPYIDEHAVIVKADPETTWPAVLRVMCHDPEDPVMAEFFDAASAYFTREGITYRCTVNMQMGALPMKSAISSDKRFRRASSYWAR